MENTILHWHPAFAAALRIELTEQLDVLKIEDEHILGHKPMQIDTIVIKKNKNVHINNRIGHIFRKHNIIEYKSPDDYLSINDFYKVYGYTCFYQSDTKSVLEILPTELTITFVCYHYPREMLRYLKGNRNLVARKYSEGIYYLYGDSFPIQILLVNQLPSAENFWLSHLRNNLQTGEEIQNLVRQYNLNKNSKWHQDVMNVIVNANRSKILEEKKMCEALREIFAEELKESNEQGKEIGENRKLIDQICKKLRKQKTVTQIAEDLEELPETIKPIAEAAAGFAPEYDAEKVFEHIYGQSV